MNIQSRQERLDLLNQHTKFDAIILGGGINGACVYGHLCRQGYRVVLLDKGDFASGTSQASAMMIWGGLLYLRNLDFPTVFELCRSRDRMIKEMPDLVAVHSLRYLPSRRGDRGKVFVHMVLWVYWLMSLMRREPPRAESRFAELSLLQDDLIDGSLLYQEAALTESDARFVLQWITRYQNSDCIAVNYCHSRGEYNAKDQCWHLDIEDKFTRKTFCVKGSLIINCAGVWTDELNQQFGIRTPVRHALSKGVFLNVKRPDLHKTHLIFELGEHGDVIALLPWGPVALWGPTETGVNDIEEGFEVTSQDVSYLSDHYHKRFSNYLTQDDIVAFRSGIRPLVVPVAYRSGRYPLDLSRRHKIVLDPNKPWISCYGGKFTGCQAMARKVVQVASRWLPGPRVDRPAQRIGMEWVRFPGIDNLIPSAAFCRDYEFCCTLDDYLRRRTNISQWISRDGLGVRHENAGKLKELAAIINGGDLTRAEQEVTAYTERVERRRNRALGGV